MLLFINIVKDELLRYLCFSVFLFGRVCVVLCCGYRTCCTRVGMRRSHPETNVLCIWIHS